MNETVLLADDDGNYYAFDSALLDGARTADADGEYFDVSVEQVSAARLSDESRAAVHLALGYERVGGTCGPVSGEELAVGRSPRRRFARLGSIGAL